MIQAILGKKGSGKTKRILDMANEALKDEQGQIIFIDDNKRYMYDLKHEIRFVDASEYALGENRSKSWFYGLLGGMLAVNFDITRIYVDAFFKLVNNKDTADLESIFEQMESLAKDHNVTFVLSVSGDPDELPEFITKYAI